jgi:anti-anti-sigma factor
MMEIKNENYRIRYDESVATVSFEGSLRLNGMEEYAPIAQLLADAIEQEPPSIALDLKDLKFLNSSGISMLSKFAIDVRNKKNIQMTVIGSQDTPWQSKSLKNLQRLMPSLKLEWV